MPEILAQPKWVLYLRAARALLAVLVLGLAAYTMQIISFPQAQLNVFAAVFTFLVTVYIFVSEISVPKAYNRWLLLALEILSLIFWLSAFASLAALAANADACFDMAESYRGVVCTRRRRYRKRSLEKRGQVWDLKTAREWYAVMAAASGIGAIIFVICIILLTVFCRALQRHHALKSSAAAATTTSAPAELNSPPILMHNVAAGGTVPEKMDQPPMSPISPPMSPPQQPAQTYGHPQYFPTPTSSPPPQPPTYTYPRPQVYPQPQLYQQQQVYPQPQARPQSEVQPMPYQHTGASDPQQPYQQQQPPPPATQQAPPPSFNELSATPRIPESRSELRS
ncbi:MAG: hypothetical protein M1815_001414 [Lichina confinis]|nr:MAG: hypothetical protein M1815_001414 [Lichina confinis]